MNILLKNVRICGFRGLENIEIDLEPITILVGANNCGKTTFLRALQLAMTNSISISVDDFFYSESLVCDKILIDLQFIPVNDKFERIDEFSEEWAGILKENRITITAEGQQVLSYRTVIEEDTLKKVYRKRQYLIDEWKDFENTGNYWHQSTFTSEISFYFDEVPYFYIDANRDILEDLKSKSSYLGKLLSSIEYNQEDRKAIEEMIKDLNKLAIEKSDVLSHIEETLLELDTAMDNPYNTVNLSPFTKKIKDLNKGVSINYSEFSMDYHGMGTRSWSSLLILKSFLKYYNEKYNASGQVYYPILAIEEPESHLHPNAQKKLYSQIKNITGQKIISTHSNYIAGTAELTEIRCLNKKSSGVVIGSIDKTLNGEEIRKIKRQVINTRGELFFAKIVVLFEGETEEQALPLLIEKYFNKTAIELGIDFIGVGGSGNYFPFIKFCESYNIEYLILSDNEEEANETVTKQISKSVEKNMERVVFLNEGNDFENELCKNGYIDEVKKAYYKLELEKCEHPAHKDAKKKELDLIKDDEYYPIITKLKTQFAPLVSQELFDSEKPLPEQIINLFKKIDKILNPTPHE